MANWTRCHFTLFLLEFTRLPVCLLKVSSCPAFCLTVTCLILLSVSVCVSIFIFCKILLVLLGLISSLVILCKESVLDALESRASMGKNLSK